MPLISSNYRAPFLFRGPSVLSGHLSTIYPSLFRRVDSPNIQRERLELPDGDFLDLNWNTSPDSSSKSLAILGHGLEGNSSAKYIRGMSLALLKQDWDTLAWNCRGCSGEPNRLLRSYHSGISEDLGHVVDLAIAKSYSTIALIGFSLGGNIVLKYLGEQGDRIAPQVKAGIAFSVPCDLTSSSLRLGEFDNQIYMSRFMEGLKEKVRQKDKIFPGKLDLSDLHRVKTFAEFDDRFTAPLNGFKDARDYWTRASSKPHLSKITIPTLLVQAQNDPFLAPPCFPKEIAEIHPHLHLEIPTHGGHVGYVQHHKEYWSETRATDFLKEVVS